MTLAEAAPPPLNLASWNLCVLGVAVAGDAMHAEFVPMSQCRHLAIVACVDSLCAIRTIVLECYVFLNKSSSVVFLRKCAFSV